MHKQELYDLTQKYLAGTITPEERQRLQDWYQAGTDEELELRIPALERGEDEAALQARMLGKIRATMEPAVPEPLPRPLSKEVVRRLPWRYVAAAAVLALLVFGSYFAIRNRGGIHSPAQQPIAATKNDVAPGTTQAVLTLADGRQIMLDSKQADHQLAVQGQTKVTNEHGTITYSGKTAPELLYNTLTTRRGEQSPPLTLSDGTKVWLNVASSIRFPVAFTSDARDVTITGEAYFEVAADKNKPFHINITGKGNVTVLGTHFNINAYDDEPTINTTLLEGAVSVNAQGTGNPESTVLKPGQQAQMNNGHIVIASNADMEEIMAWKNGYFSFNKATTEAIMRQVGRWYDAEIIYEGDVKNERFVGSVPRSANASKLLEVLALTKTVQFVIEDKKIIVKPYHP